MTSGEAGPDPGSAFVAPELPDSAALWLLRHGETEWSASGQHTSHTDVALTDAGERQAEALRSVVAELKPTLVLCSPRRRARDTAGLAGLHVDEIDDDLVEWDYGAFEGRTTAEIRKSIPDWTIWDSGVPGGETASQVGARADRVLARATSRLADGPVVLVGHGHFSRVLAARWIGLPVTAGARLLLGTAATSVLGAQYGTPLIVRWNIPNPAA
jgi:broad specificity phosphatase PhoE